MTTPERDRLFEEGGDAWVQGKRLTDNPYDQEKAPVWAQGFSHAADEHNPVYQCGGQRGE